MKDVKNKNILIGGLLAIILVMAAGYAAFATQLSINGTTTASSSWNVHFQTQENVAGTATSGTTGGSVPTGTVSASGTSATISTTLYQPGDTVTYTLPVVNEGTIDAQVRNITVNGGSSSAITYSVTGLNEGDVINKQGDEGSTANLVVTVTYDDSTEEQPSTDDLTSSLTVTINFEQQTDSYYVYADNTETMTIGTSTLSDLGTYYDTFAEATTVTKNIAFKYKVDSNDVLVEGYVCFVNASNVKYCLKGYDTNAYSSNVAIVKEAFNCNRTSCYDDTGSASVYSNGMVGGMSYLSRHWHFDIYSDGTTYAGDA